MPRRKEESDEEEDYEEEERAQKKVRSTRSTTAKTPRAPVLRKRKAEEEDEEEFKPTKKTKKTPTKKKSTPTKKKKKIESDEDEEFEISEEEDEEEEDDWEEEERKKKLARTAKSKVKCVTSNKPFKINLQNGEEQTVEVVIGNFHNAYEGACEESNLAASWLNEEPPKNKTGGTVMVRDVSMKIPALSGQWNVAQLRNNEGVCCGVFFWHNEQVGADVQSAVNLIREFTALGMEEIENVEKKETKEKGLRLIGRYSWDYYRSYGEDLDDVNDLFDGPHCFFVPADHYKDSVYPDILKRSDSGGRKGYKPYLTKIDENGALALFEGQEYMFAKVFLHGNDVDGKKEWIGVKAMLVFTYGMGEWADTSVDDVPIVVSQGNDENPDGNTRNNNDENDEKEKVNAENENEQSVKEIGESEKSNS